MSSLDEIYSRKEIDYFSQARTDVISFLPAYSDRALEIGCGTGATLSLLKSLGRAKNVVGIEGFSEAASIAATVLDEAICYDLNDPIDNANLGEFDLILCLDVLEHLVTPIDVLRSLKNILKPNGTLVVSLPNVRFAPVLFSLLFLGRWDYVDEGVLDRTHLRFFTKSTGRELIEDAGFKLMATNSPPFSLQSSASVASLLSLGLLNDFFARQFIFTACHPSF